MKNLLLNEKMIERALNPAKWTIASSILPIEAEFCDNKQYTEWAKNKHDSHSQREILFAFSGNIFHTFQGRCCKCTPGSLFLFDSFETHDEGFPPNREDFTHLWLMFIRNKIFADLYSVKKKGYTTRRFTLGNPELELFINTWNDLKEKHSLFTNEFKRQKLVSAFSNILLKIIEESCRPEPPEVAVSQKETIETIMAHLKAGCGKGENIRKLARIAGYSNFHFLRLFKKYSGQTVLEFINKCRMETTEEMLRKGIAKKEIAYKLGFSSPAAYSNWYKEKFN